MLHQSHFKLVYFISTFSALLHLSLLHFSPSASYSPPSSFLPVSRILSPPPSFVLKPSRVKLVQLTAARSADSSVCAAATGASYRSPLSHIFQTFSIFGTESSPDLIMWKHQPD